MALLRGYLFAIADERRTFVKIGMARDVHSKFHSLRADFPVELKLVDYRQCTYAKFREAKVHTALKDLCLRGDWYRWDEPRMEAAIDSALAIPDSHIKSALAALPEKKSRNYPVRRDDTGEIFPTARQAALTVLGSEKLALKIRQAIKAGAKCGPATWSKA